LNNLDFDNSAFWDRRYADDPSLGSGVGSRGENLLHKRKIIESFLRNAAPETILDVGCGDHEVLRGVEHLPGYLGVDVSAVAVSRNQRLFPHLRFKQLDFVSCADVQTLRSDVVLCLEVLIHQHRREDYDAFIRNLVAATAKRGLVSGYMFDPRPEISSGIIAFHEPIMDALTRAGAKRVRVDARSLESDCLAFVSFER
jgi:2-polyprenyl-3-methyl-5-hydroxy-6-metoxy-1,4-benzoquinol methylase